MHTISFHPFPVLTTERLVLRALTRDDRVAVFKLRTNTEVNRYIMREREKTQEAIDGFITRITNGMAENKWVHWAITDRQNGKFIGTICLWNFAFDANEAELGFEMMPENRGKGIMHEALNAVVRYGFETLQLVFISAYTNKDNAASIRLLERNNFLFLPERRDGHFADNRVFGLKNGSIKNAAEA